MTTMTYSTTLEYVECCNCGVPFGISTSLNKELLRDHARSFYCPNGHSQHHIGETDAQKEKRLRKWAEDQAASERARADRAEASRRAWKGQTTRLRNRAAEGQCPFCGSFRVDLAVHVATKHPDERARELTEEDAG